MKKDYVMPRTLFSRVELEQGFMAASKEEIKDQNVNVTIDRQESETDFTVDGWD